MSDVSLTVALALGAAIAAPVVAAFVAGTGATGLIGGGLTILGTAGTVGLGGAALGGGSTLAAGGTLDQAEADAWKYFSNNECWLDAPRSTANWNAMVIGATVQVVTRTCCTPAVWRRFSYRLALDFTTA